MRKLTRNLDIFLYLFKQNDGIDGYLVLPVMLQILNYNLKDFGGQMGRKDALVL